MTAHTCAQIDRLHCGSGCTHTDVCFGIAARVKVGILCCNARVSEKSNDEVKLDHASFHFCAMVVVVVVVVAMMMW